MKIAFIHPALMDYRLEIFEKLSRNYNVTFLFTKQGRGQQNVKENHLQAPSHWTCKYLNTKFLFINTDVGMLLKLISDIYFNDYDLLIVSTKGLVCWPIAKLKRKKVIVWTEFWNWQNKTLFQQVVNKSTFFVYRHSDAIIATGRKVYEVQESLGVDKSKIFMYPQCAEDYTTIIPENMELGSELVGKKIILYCGRIIKWKGLHVLIKALHMLNLKIENTHLVILGRGPFEDECKKIAKDLNVTNISFMGYVDTPVKAFFYKHCNIFVIPSLFYKGDYEPWGLVVNEAMAFGKPVIATTAVGSAFDLINDGINGFIVEQGNSMNMCDAMYTILTSEEIEDEMGKNSLTVYAEKNDYSKLFNCFRLAIDSVRH